MKCSLFVVLVACVMSLEAQENNHNDWIGTRMTTLPVQSSYSTTGIADFINQQFSTDYEKVYAAYSWITSNIHYNKDSMFYRFWGDDPERKLSSVLKTRKGVCEDFASLFTAIVQRCGIPAYTVTGYTKTMGRLNSTGHSWCAVKVQQQWLLCDPTWDENCHGIYRFFLVRPTRFIDTHFPFDPLWQLLKHPVAARVFKNGGSSQKTTAVFHYADSADAFLQQDTVTQKESVARRLLQNGLEDEQLQTWYSYNKMKIRIVQEEADMTTFNAAVADYNEAKSLYNDFVIYRNNQFQPARTEAAVQAMFDKIEQLLQSAYRKKNLVGSKTENFQYDTDGLQQRLEALRQKIDVQKTFISTDPAFNQPAQPHSNKRPSKK